MAQAQYDEIIEFLALARIHFGGIVKIQYPEVPDPMFRFPEALGSAVGLSAKLNEPVLLEMGAVGIVCASGRYLPPIDFAERKVLSEDEVGLMHVFARGNKKPEYLLDVDYGSDTRIYAARIEDLRRRGVPKLKGDWAGAEEAPHVSYPQPASP